MVNRTIDDFKSGYINNLINEFNDKNFQYIGTISEDEMIMQYELIRTSLLEIPDSSKAYKDLKKNLEKINLFSFKESKL